ncbi:hypothetical protein ACFXKY_07905 [Streptomyces canus]
MTPRPTDPEPEQPRHTPLAVITPADTVKAADRVTGGPGRRPTTFDSAL